MKCIFQLIRLIVLSRSPLKWLLDFAKPFFTLAVALLCINPSAFRAAASASQTVDNTEVFSKFVGTWDVKLIGGKRDPILDGSSEITLVDENWLEVHQTFSEMSFRTIVALHSLNDTFEGVGFHNLGPFFTPMKGKLDVQANTITFECDDRVINTGEVVKRRWVWSIPKDDAFSMTKYFLNDDGTIEEMGKINYLRRTKLPAARPEAQDVLRDEEQHPPAKRPTPDELEKYLGDWEIVSELSDEGVRLPVSSEGGKPPDGDPKAYMRIKSDYVTELPWDRTGASEAMIRESAHEVEWNEIDSAGIHGELYMAFHGVRNHVGSCVMKVTGKRALLRMDQPARRVTEPFKLDMANDLNVPSFSTILSMVRADAANAIDRK